jgi:hypothetical protein
VTRLPSLEEQNSRAHAAYCQVERYIFETEIVPRITAEIIEEHRATPVGKHSDELERVLTYLRKNQVWVGDGAGNVQRTSSGVPLLAGVWYLAVASRAPMVP